MQSLPLWPRTLHHSDRPSLTAQATTLMRALELDRERAEQIVSDEFAPVFLPGPARRAYSALRAGRAGMHVIERMPLAGVATSVLCRHCFMDLRLLEALPDVEQVLVLGAGYDSRAYRFASAIGPRPVFEVDLPPLSRAKRRIVADRPDVFTRGRVRSVEIDFRTQRLTDRLADSDFVVGAPTFVVWEGVSMYLSPDAVDDTLAALAALCGAGSTLVMDFWQGASGVSPSALLRRAGVLGVGLIGEPVTCSVPVERVGELLGRAGFEVSDVATADVMDRRYATPGRRCEPAMYSVAALRV